MVAHLRQQELYGEPQNLGALLLSFLRKFGWEYDYNNMAISLEENDSTGELYQHEAWWLNARLNPKYGLPTAYSERELPLHIQDPLQPANDIGRPTRDMAAVRTMFRKTHAALIAPRGAFVVALPCLGPTDPTPASTRMLTKQLRRGGGGGGLGHRSCRLRRARERGARHESRQPDAHALPHRIHQQTHAAQDAAAAAAAPAQTTRPHARPPRTVQGRGGASAAPPKATCGFLFVSPSRSSVDMEREEPQWNNARDAVKVAFPPHLSDAYGITRERCACTSTAPRPRCAGRAGRRAPCSPEPTSLTSTSCSL